MLIRLADQADTPQVSDLWLAFMRELNRRHIRTVRATQQNRARVERHLTDLVPLGQVLVLVNGEQVLGFSTITANVPRLDLFYASASISDVYVAPSVRGQGWGKALVKETIQVIRDRGLHTVSLNVHVGNHEAEALYRALGFRPVQQQMLLALDDEFVRWGSDKA